MASTEVMMPAAYPIELRRRVVEAHENGEGTFTELAERFKVGEATVNRWVSLKRRTGDLKPLPRLGRPQARLVTPAGEEFLAGVLDDVPDSTVAELVAAYAEEFGVRMGRTTMHDTLVRLNYTRKRGRSGHQAPGARMCWQPAKRS
jgi:transposase